MKIKDLKIKDLKINDVIKIGLIILVLLPIFLSSIIDLYEKRNIIFKKVAKELKTEKAYQFYIPKELWA